MAKQSKDPEEKARRQLAKVQLKLQVAVEKQSQVRAKGHQEIEKARLRAAQWEAKAIQRVQRRVEAVARAEQQLHVATGKTEPEGQTTDTLVETAANPGDGSAIVIPESVEVRTRGAESPKKGESKRG